MKQHPSNQASIVALISVFFFWGFLAASNGIFIPFCKTHFSLSQFQSQLIDFAFYTAYFIGSLILYMFSLQFNRDIINKVGYKTTIIYGLFISIIGALIMIPAVNSGSFMFILGAFFIIALGFSLQQTSANPLVLNLGNPATGSYRLNFAGSVNSLGTAIGPILVSLVLFGKAIATDDDKIGASLGSINILYVILAVAFALAIMILFVSKIPKLEMEDNTTEVKVLKGPLYFVMGILIFLILIFLFFTIDSKELARPDVAEDQSKFLFLAAGTVFLLIILALLIYLYKKISREDRFEKAPYPQVILGMLAIFVYVGVEVTVQSNLGTLLKTPEFGSLEDSQIGPFISLYWGSLMIGRWTGAIGAFNLKKGLNTILTIVIPFAALAFVLFMNHLSGADVSSFYLYAICVAVLLGGFLLGKQRPAFTLMLFGILGTIAMIVGLLTHGTIGIYALLSGGLFCSIMWPCIFSLAIAGLGKYTSQASGFLIMMILGGAFIPPVQGLLADMTNIHISYIIPVFCFIFLAWYAWKMKKILISKGIDYDSASEKPH
ncbi:MAG: MFS transporter [Bacteroidota bacterium]|nr:MFS transporter [Bacteroidota bacterium]